jgi:hypothetical protein
VRVIQSVLVAEIRKHERYATATGDGGVRQLDEPMEATLADAGGMARMTWSITGAREAAGTWLMATVEFVGFGVQVCLDDPMLRIDQVRELGSDLWRIADRQEGEAAAVFEPMMRLRARAPSRLSARIDVALDFEIGTDVRVGVNLQSEGTLVLAFVEALERALEAVEELRG